MLNLKQVTSEDDLFLFEVYADTRREEMAIIGWGPQEQEVFLRMQFDAQRRSYAMQYPEAQHEIVMQDQTRIGRIVTEIRDEALLLIDLSLLSSYRKNGIGTRLIQDLQQQAKQMGKSVRLHVLQTNPALQLYERLGFRVTGERIPYVAMEWQAE